MDLQSQQMHLSAFVGLCVVRIMLYAQEGNGILLSFNQPCTDHVGKLAVCNNSKKRKGQIYSVLYFMMIYLMMMIYFMTVICEVI